MGNNNNNGPKWKRPANNTLELNMSKLGRGAPARTSLRNRAGLTPLSNLNTNDTPIYSAKLYNWNSVTGKDKYRYFFPVNRGPNFMERRPTMKAMLNRVKKNSANSATRRRNNRRPVPRNVEKLLPKGLLANSPNSPNPFEGIFSPKRPAKPAAKPAANTRPWHGRYRYTRKH